MNSKVLCTLIGMTLALFAISNIQTDQTKENFWNTPGFAYTAVPSTETSNIRGFHDRSRAMNGDYFISNPNFQANLSPRFNNSKMGSLVRYKLPGNEFLAGSNDPVNFSNCGANKPRPPPPPQPQTDENQIIEENFEFERNPNITNKLQAGNITEVNSNGMEGKTQIILDRFMYTSNKPRFLRNSSPCFIRGDIVPSGQQTQSISHGNPATDLRMGAINVLAGIENESGRALNAARHAATGGLSTPFLGSTMARSENTTHSGRFDDVQVTSFPQ